MMRATLGALASALTIASVLIASSPVEAGLPKGMRPYVFLSGALTLDKSILQNGASGKVQIPVAFFRIKYPLGNAFGR